jgi:uncharacterized protein (TIGR00251 family)
VENLDVRDSAEGARLSVRVKPRASKSRVVGVREGALEVAVAAPPVDGEANATLIAFMSKTLGVAKSALTLVSGETSRLKVLSVSGLSASELRAALAGRATK